MKRTHLLPLLLCALAACSDRGDEVPPALVAQRHAAASNACVSRELLQRAEGNLQTLQATGAPGLISYAQVYLQHAQLRAGAFAQLDSAANFSREPGDSARHAQAARRYVVTAPEPGSLDANVVAQYQRDFVQLRSDADHLCNWNFEELDSGRGGEK